MQAQQISHAMILDEFHEPNGEGINDSDGSSNIADLQKKSV